MGCHYDSKFTGKEIDEALDFILNVKQWVQVWGGACGQLPVSCGVKIKDTKINPDTLDWTGYYKIITGDKNKKLTDNNPSHHKGGHGTSVNFIEVKNTANHSMGTSGGWISPNDNVEISSLDVDGLTESFHTVISQEESRTLPEFDLPPRVEGSDGVVRLDITIHEIWRYQSIHKSDLC